MQASAIHHLGNSTEDHKRRQVNNVAMITFWSQFSVYVLNTVLVLYLTRSVLLNGLGYSSGQAYLFIGVSQAMGYIMPLIGGQMADKVLGLTRSIFIGSALVAVAYLLVMVSGMLVPSMGDKVFIAAYALVPAMNSLLMGTTSALVSKVYARDDVKAKAGMTLFYMSINVGSLLATIIAPQLLESRYGPLSIFAVVFIGKSISSLNFLYRYELYDDVMSALDKAPFSFKKGGILTVYLLSIYLATLFVYFHPEKSSFLIGIGAILGIVGYFIKTFQLHGEERMKQIIAGVLICEAVIFFVLYNQMNTTMVLFAKEYTDLTMLLFHVSPAHYQMLNPILIIGLSMVLPKFYERYQKFSIPYQFAAGTMLAGIGLLVMYLGCFVSGGITQVNGNFLVLTYALLTLAELWVSAIGLSMIGLYCSHQMIGFAMGVWYLSNSLSNVFSGALAQWVAMPKEGIAFETGMKIYQQYYFDMGLFALLVGMAIGIGALFITRKMARRGIVLV